MKLLHVSLALALIFVPLIGLFWWHGGFSAVLGLLIVIIVNASILTAAVYLLDKDFFQDSARGELAGVYMTPLMANTVWARTDYERCGVTPNNLYAVISESSNYFSIIDDAGGLYGGAWDKWERITAEQLEAEGET